MSSVNDILNRARERAEQQGFNFSGEVTPAEALELLQHAPGTVIVDVRTQAEWDWVGRVPGAIEIDWVQYPDMTRNPNFIAALERAVDRKAIVLFLCRSGVRSRSAASAAIDAGYTSAYNILEGFEGDKDASNHRGTLGGWRFHGLPWYQG
ncbi:MAG: rhodanese-like domain-containing protein [Sphingomonadaceae bacterium]|nr:rhodanese-like domain-containing protein [Sphingomonadaceae bacterium]